ncbi:MAG: hypothetical protein ACKO37_10020 [Vampirovibrionales bacterium]
MISPATVFPSQQAYVQHNMLGNLNTTLVQGAYQNPWEFVQYNPLTHVDQAKAGDRTASTGRASDYWGGGFIWGKSDAQKASEWMTDNVMDGPIVGKNPVTQVLPNGVGFNNLSRRSDYYNASTNTIAEIANFRGSVNTQVGTAVRPNTNTLLPVFSSLQTPSALGIASSVDWFVRSGQLNDGYDGSLVTNNNLNPAIVYPYTTANYLEDTLPPSQWDDPNAPLPNQYAGPAPYPLPLSPTTTGNATGISVGNTTQASRTVSLQSYLNTNTASSTSSNVGSATQVPRTMSIGQFVNQLTAAGTSSNTAVSTASSVQVGNTVQPTSSQTTQVGAGGNTIPVYYVENIPPQDVFKRYYNNPYGVNPNYTSLFPTIGLMPAGINAYMGQVISTNFLGT